MHGPTFMGNALACAAANASLDLFEREPRLEQARAIGALLAERLEPAREMPGVADVRVKGALGVIEVETMRSEERRVGKECVSTCRSRWSRADAKKKTRV